MQKGDLIVAGILFLFIMGWVDWLWLFGFEDSKSYTWWALIYWMGN